MLFTLAQVIGVLAAIKGVPEAKMEQRAALLIALVKQTMHRHGK